MLSTSGDSVGRSRKAPSTVTSSPQGESPRAMQNAKGKGRSTVSLSSTVENSRPSRRSGGEKGSNRHRELQTPIRKSESGSSTATVLDMASPSTADGGGGRCSSSPSLREEDRMSQGGSGSPSSANPGSSPLGLAPTNAKLTKRRVSLNSQSLCPKDLHFHTTDTAAPSAGTGNVTPVRTGTSPCFSSSSRSTLAATAAAGQSRGIATSAVLQAFLMGIQNCLDRQEMVFHRLDTAMAEMSSSSSFLAPPSGLQPTTAAQTGAASRDQRTLLTFGSLSSHPTYTLHSSSTGNDAIPECASMSSSEVLALTMAAERSSPYMPEGSMSQWRDGYPSPATVSPTLVHSVTTGTSSSPLDPLDPQHMGRLSTSCHWRDRNGSSDTALDQRGTGMHCDVSQPLSETTVTSPRPSVIVVQPNVERLRGAAFSLVPSPGSTSRLSISPTQVAESAAGTEGSNTFISTAHLTRGRTDQRLFHSGSYLPTPRVRATSSATTVDEKESTTGATLHPFAPKALESMETSVDGAAMSRPVIQRKRVTTTVSTTATTTPAGESIANAAVGYEGEDVMGPMDAQHFVSGVFSAGTGHLYIPTSIDSVSLSPLSRPISTWGESPMTCSMMSAMGSPAAGVGAGTVMAVDQLASPSRRSTGGNKSPLILSLRKPMAAMVSTSTGSRGPWPTTESATPVSSQDDSSPRQLSNPSYPGGFATSLHGVVRDVSSPLISSSDGRRRSWGGSTQTSIPAVGSSSFAVVVSPSSLSSVSTPSQPQFTLEAGRHRSITPVTYSSPQYRHRSDLSLQHQLHSLHNNTATSTSLPSPISVQHSSVSDSFTRSSSSSMAAVTQRHVTDNTSSSSIAGAPSGASSPTVRPPDPVLFQNRSHREMRLPVGAMDVAVESRYDRDRPHEDRVKGRGSEPFFSSAAVAVAAATAEGADASSQVRDSAAPIATSTTAATAAHATPSRYLSFSPTTSLEQMEDTAAARSALSSVETPLVERDDTEPSSVAGEADEETMMVPPPALPDLQQRRFSAPPVPTMRRPPVAPVGAAAARRRGSAGDSDFLHASLSAINGSTSNSPMGNPSSEEWLSFERRHEQLHLPACWQSSEVVVVEHAEEENRQRDAEVEVQLRLLEEELAEEMDHGTHSTDSFPYPAFSFYRPYRRSRRRRNRRTSSNLDNFGNNGSGGGGSTSNGSSEEVRAASLQPDESDSFDEGNSDDNSDDKFNDAAAETYERRLALYGHMKLMMYRQRNRRQRSSTGLAGNRDAPCARGTTKDPVPYTAVPTEEYRRGMRGCSDEGQSQQVLLSLDEDAVFMEADAVRSSSLPASQPSSQRWLRHLHRSGQDLRGEDDDEAECGDNGAERGGADAGRGGECHHTSGVSTGAAGLAAGLRDLHARYDELVSIRRHYTRESSDDRGVEGMTEVALRSCLDDYAERVEGGDGGDSVHHRGCSRGRRRGSVSPSKASKGGDGETRGLPSVVQCSSAEDADESTEGMEDSFHSTLQRKIAAVSTTAGVSTQEPNLPATLSAASAKEHGPLHPDSPMDSKMSLNAELSVPTLSFSTLNQPTMEVSAASADGNSHNAAAAPTDVPQHSRDGGKWHSVPSRTPRLRLTRTPRGTVQPNALDRSRKVLVFQSAPAARKGVVPIPKLPSKTKGGVSTQPPLRLVPGPLKKGFPKRSDDTSRPLAVSALVPRQEGGTPEPLATLEEQRQHRRGGGSSLSNSSAALRQRLSMSSSSAPPPIWQSSSASAMLTEDDPCPEGLNTPPPPGNTSTSITPVGTATSTPVPEPSARQRMAAAGLSTPYSKKKKKRAADGLGGSAKPAKRRRSSFSGAGPLSCGNANGSAVAGLLLPSEVEDGSSSGRAGSSIGVRSDKGGAVSWTAPLTQLMGSASAGVTRRRRGSFTSIGSLHSNHGNDGGTALEAGGFSGTQPLSASRTMWTCHSASGSTVNNSSDSRGGGHHRSRPFDTNGTAVSVVASSEEKPQRHLDASPMNEASETSVEEGTHTHADDSHSIRRQVLRRGSGPSPSEGIGQPSLLRRMAAEKERARTIEEGLSTPAAATSTPTSGISSAVEEEGGDAGLDIQARNVDYVPLKSPFLNTNIDLSPRLSSNTNGDRRSGDRSGRRSGRLEGGTASSSLASPSATLHEDHDHVSSPRSKQRRRRQVFNTRVTSKLPSKSGAASSRATTITATTGATHNATTPATGTTTSSPRTMGCSGGGSTFLRTSSVSWCRSSVVTRGGEERGTASLVLSGMSPTGASLPSLPSPTKAVKVTVPLQHTTGITQNATGEGLRAVTARGSHPLHYSTASSAVNVPSVLNRSRSPGTMVVASTTVAMPRPRRHTIGSDVLSSVPQRLRVMRSAVPDRLGGAAEI